jgi:hypothetical protein
MARPSTVKPSIATGADIDGFTIGECVHRGGMATLWSVTHPGITVPLLMKVPLMSEGEDPAAIVSFEMEQMILPRLSGPHVPACFGSGDFARQPYVVMERIPGKTLYDRLADLPLNDQEARGHRRKDRGGTGRPAPAERHSSRYQAEQRDVSALGRGGADRLWIVASQSSA